MRRSAAGVLAVVAWYGLALQLVLILTRASREGIPIAAELIRFASYFTIQTNMLVATAASALALAPMSPPGRWFSRPHVAGAIAAYIGFVGSAYELLLRHTWDPQGRQRVADALLHDVTPLVFIAYWFAFVPKRALNARVLAGWLLFPVAYAAYAMTRGALTGAYPYHFLDPATEGARGSAAAIALLCAGMLVVFGLVLGLDRTLPRREPA